MTVSTFQTQQQQQRTNREIITSSAEKEGGLTVSCERQLKQMVSLSTRIEVLLRWWMDDRMSCHILTLRRFEGHRFQLPQFPPIVTFGRAIGTSRKGGNGGN